jgi:hypothetical protein
MSERIRLDKGVFSKESFDRLVDRSFKSLGQTTIDNAAPEFTVTDFFALYESLFYQIPKEGDLESHRYILNKTASYLGVPIGDELDIQALLNEITTLRNELLNSNKTLLDLTKK